MTSRNTGRLFAGVIAAWLLLAVSAYAEDLPERKLIAVEGQGYLETVGGYRVLHLEGTPAEMGYQHGVLLGDAVRKNIEYMLDDRPGEELRLGKLTVPRKLLAGLLNQAFEERVPERFVTEMDALAEGAGLPAWQVKAANLIPEAFHCSGFALLETVTATGELYHGRVLDYAVNSHLQDHAVLILQKPDGRHPFANVSYAGFIGSVTGMNRSKISIGEMGGGGVGRWDGVPMSFLVRMVLEEAGSLEEAIAVFAENPRTCEYYYVIADGAANSAVGMRATSDVLELVRPGEAHSLLKSPVDDTVLLSAGDRYGNLSRLVAERHGTFTRQSALRLMDAPVAMKANLHNALMVPAAGEIFVANASPEGEPAWQQTYHHFDLDRLLGERPAGKTVTDGE